MINMKKIFLLGTFFCGLVFNGQVFAQTDSTDKIPMVSEIMIQKMMTDFSNCPQYMQLNENQKTDIKKITNDFQSKVEPVKKELTDKMTELQTQMMQSSIDEKQINKSTKEVSDLYDKIFKEYMDVMVKIKDATGFSLMVCNPDMQKMMAEQQDYLHSTLSSSSQRGLNNSSSQGMQNASSQGLQTAPSSSNQTVSSVPECSGGVSSNGKTCVFPLSENN